MRNAYLFVSVALTMGLLASGVASAQTPPAAPSAPESGVVVTKRPDGDEFSRFYPRQAQRFGVGGRAVLNCVIGASHAPENCQVETEKPAGYGFGEGASKAATQYMRFKSTTPGSQDDIGKPVKIPINFGLEAGPPIPVEPVAPAVDRPDDSSLYPAQALAKPASGLVVLTCPVAADRTLGACTQKSGTSDRFGLVTAARKLAEGLRLKDDQPLAPTVEFTVVFKAGGNGSGEVGYAPAPGRR